MYLNPEHHMDAGHQLRIVQWLEANGCRDLIAMLPIVVKGKTAHYHALCRKDPKALKRVKVRDDTVVTRRRAIRLRIPLSDIPREDIA